MKIKALSKDKFDKLINELRVNDTTVSLLNDKYFICISHTDIMLDKDEEWNLLFKQNHPNVLRQFFDDVLADAFNLKAFTKDQADEVIGFLKNIKNPETAELIIHCAMGSSRSVAIGEFAAKMFGQDPDWIEARIDRSANKHVLTVLEKQLKKSEAKSPNFSKYKVLVSTMSPNETLVCDIDSPNLVFCDSPTHSGAQCNFVGGTEEHDKVQDLCRQIADLFIELHKLNEQS